MAVQETRKTIHVGVFIPSFVQLLDLACVDIFASGSFEYLSALSPLVPEAVYSLAPSVKIYYIGTSPPSSPQPLTACASLVVTHHYLSSPEVQPGRLDILLVPGPDPKATWDAEVTDWLARHHSHGRSRRGVSEAPEEEQEGTRKRGGGGGGGERRTDILSVCTGIYLCGAAGLLANKKVCGPRGLQAELKTKFGSEEKGIEWVGEHLRWVRGGDDNNDDGGKNFWSCGGVTNGNDLVAAYMRANTDKFPGPVTEFALMLTETGDRPQRYEVGKVGFTLGVVWQVLKAVVMGFGKKKKGE